MARTLAQVLISPRNSWTWRFVPGVLLGFALARLWAAEATVIQRPKRKRKPAKPVKLAPGEELKVVLVVNGSLKMGKGKIAAQCAHGAVGLYQEHSASNRRLFKLWEESSGQKKIALNCPDGSELMSITRAAEQSGCLNFLVQDAGRTQVAAGSCTVLALGPATDKDLQFTRHLKLL